MKEIIKKIGRKAGIEISRVRDRDVFRTVSLKPHRTSKGNVLLSYRTEPFLGGEKKRNTHIAFWDCFQLGMTFVNLGYSLDVIHWLNDQFVPEKEYAYFIDVNANLERIGRYLDKSCIRIMQAIWAHWLFHNTAEYQRCLNLQQRRGISLAPKRQLPPAKTIEHADCAIVMGNEFTMGTYRFAQKPLYSIPVSAQTVYPWNESKNYDVCRNRFMWFAGYGLVHKGLDLVLDAFAEMPEYHLTVCGSISFEKDFDVAYYRELYQTRNIQTVGWVDVTSPAFTEIAGTCVGTIYPSCSEGQSGCVVNCLHAGLIPIISRESGVNVQDFGIILPECSKEAIKESVKKVSSLSLLHLQEMSHKAWEYARSMHTLEKVEAEYQRVVGQIISQYGH